MNKQEIVEGLKAFRESWLHWTEYKGSEHNAQVMSNAISVLEQIDEEKLRELIYSKGNFMHGIAKDIDCKEVVNHVDVVPEELSKALCNFVFGEEPKNR